MPFLQIFAEEHKAVVHVKQPEALISIYFLSERSRMVALSRFEDLGLTASVASETKSPCEHCIMAPLAAVTFAYITGPHVDLRPPCEYVSGRDSEPSLQMSNLDALACYGHIALIQHNDAEPMCSHSLLMS